MHQVHRHYTVSLLISVVVFSLFYIYKRQEENSMSVDEALKEMSCCPRCVLRLLGERDIDLYQKSQEVKGLNRMLSEVD